MRKRVLTSDSPSTLERQWGKAELVLGSMGMVVGGFALRVGVYHEIVIVSLIFTLLGAVHLWRSRPRNPDLPFSAQRLYHRLNSSIPAEYTYYPSLIETNEPDGMLARDWLVGPWGVGVLARFGFRGTLDRTGEETWSFHPEGDQKAYSIENPLQKNQEYIHKLKALFVDHNLDPSSIPCHSFLVLMKNDVEGTALEQESVVFMHELPHQIQSRELEHVGEDRLMELEETVKSLIETQETSRSANVTNHESGV